MKINIDIEFLHSGQIRPYGDSVYEAVITHGADSMYMSDPGEEFIRKEAKLYVKNFEDEGIGDWFSPRLKEIEKLGKGKWRVKIVRAYDD